MLQCYIVTMLQNRTSLMWQSGKVAMWQCGTIMLLCFALADDFTAHYRRYNGSLPTMLRFVRNRRQRMAFSSKFSPYRLEVSKKMRTFAAY